MYKKVLVCLDGSKLAEQVLPYAAELALRCNSQVVLLRVVPQPVLISPAIPGVAGGPVVTAGMQRQAQTEEWESDTYLQDVAERLRKEHGVEAETVTLIGAPGQTIVDYASQNGVEIIAIATHGRTGASRMFFGSVADFVLRQSRLPVLLIRPTLP